MTLENAQSVRAAIYLRISLDPEMDGLAIERQREDCEKIAQTRGWTVVESYVDQSISAYDSRKERPAYERMVEDYKAGRLDAIICYDLDRLTRQPRQLEDWIELADKRGLLLATVDQQTDLTTDNGRVYARVKAAIARGEMERKSKRQSRAHLQRAQKGRAPKGTRPVGYTTNGDVIETEAEAVRAIFRAFLRGDSLGAIARSLSGIENGGAQGVPRLQKHTRTLALERNARRRAEQKAERPVPEDGPWKASTVLGILRNPRYAGYSTYVDVTKRRQALSEGQSRRSLLKDCIVRDSDGAPVKGQWEPIVSTGDWWDVQTLLEDPARVTNRTGSTQRKHLGAGLFVCGRCGQKMITRSIYYSCKAGHMNRTRGAIDDFVRRVVVARLQCEDATRLVPNVVGDDGDEISRLIEEQRGRIARAQRDYDAEIIEGEDLVRVRNKARAEIERLEKERFAKSSASALAPVLRTEDPGVAFLEASFGSQRMVIDALMEVVLQPVPRGRKGFYPESVEIKWKGGQE